MMEALKKALFKKLQLAIDEEQGLGRLENIPLPGSGGPSSLECSEAERLRDNLDHFEETDKLALKTEDSESSNLNSSESETSSEEEKKVNESEEFQTENAASPL